MNPEMQIDTAERKLPVDIDSYAETIVETMGQPLLVLDKELRIKAANRSFYQTFAVTREETENVPLLSLGNGQWNVPEVRRLPEDILRRFGQIEEFEVEHDFPLTGRRTIRINARRLNERNSRGLIMLAMEDVTSRKQVEQAWRKNEERLQFIARATHDVIRDWDVVTGEIWWSENVFEMFGYSAPEFQPTFEFWKGLIHPDDCQRTLEKMDMVLKDSEAEIWRGEYRLRRKNGSYAAVLCRGYIVRDRGQAVRMLGSLMDVTERREADEKLKVFSARLEVSNRELQDFASVASHDLQEPLRKIQAFGDRLKSKCYDSLGEDGRDFLDRMQSASARMQCLIKDLLAFARVETRNRPLMKVDLTSVVREVISDLEIQIENNGAVVEVQTLPVIEADPLQMRQLMQNLIGNSLKYHREGQVPVIKVRGKIVKEEGYRANSRNAEDREFCQVEVEDNGIGFDEKYLDRIFTVFQRLHVRKQYEGTGVGLAVCRKIAERHQGYITARSKPGEGATFIVTLPVKQMGGTES